MSKLRLDGKVAIITGAASGIGEAAARLFVSHGAIVIIADIQDDLGRTVAASIGPPEMCTYHHCDVRVEKDVEDMVNYALRTHARIDILFSNAGVIGPPLSILEEDMSNWDNVMAVNVRGTVTTIKHVARAMVARATRGAIVCTASIAACQGYPSVSYTSSKHAVLGLVRSSSVELGGYGIRVNCVSPSAVATPLACGYHGWSVSEIEEGGCAVSSLKGVVLKASHIAEAALFLASDEAGFITGQNLVVDGGRTVAPSSLPQK